MLVNVCMNNWAVEQTYIALSSTVFPESIPIPFAKGERDEARSTLEGRRRLQKDLHHLQQQPEEKTVQIHEPHQPVESTRQGTTSD